MNNFTAFHEPREANRKPRKVFYAKSNETKVEGEIFSCPHCGQSMAWTESNELTGEVEVLTNYVLPEKSRVWVYPTKGVPLRGNRKTRRQERRAMENELRTSGTPEAETKAASKELRDWANESRNHTPTNAKTGETTKFPTKSFSAQIVEVNSIFKCAHHDGGFVKIDVSNLKRLQNGRNQVLS